MTLKLFPLRAAGKSRPTETELKAPCDHGKARILV